MGPNITFSDLCTFSKSVPPTASKSLKPIISGSVKAKMSRRNIKTVKAAGSDIDTLETKSINTNLQNIMKKLEKYKRTNKNLKDPCSTIPSATVNHADGEMSVVFKNPVNSATKASSSSKGSYYSDGKINPYSEQLEVDKMHPGVSVENEVDAMNIEVNMLQTEDNDTVQKEVENRQLSDKSTMIDAGITSDKTSKYKCEKCDKGYDYYRAFLSHQSKGKCGESFECAQCQSKFASEKSLGMHVVRKHKRPVFKCAYCPKIFPTEKSLLNHVDHHHTMKSCQWCSKEYCNSNTLRSHISKCRLNTDKQNQCPKELSSIPSPRVISVAVQSLINCEHCPATFQTRGGYNKHKNHHTSSLTLGTDVTETVPGGDSVFETAHDSSIETSEVITVNNSIGSVTVDLSSAVSNGDYIEYVIV